MIDIAVSMITCDSRKQVLAQTLSEFANTDWPHSPTLFTDPYNYENRYKSQTENYGLMLRTMLEVPGWNYLLALEDDVTPNLHLYHNLQSWLPLQWGIPLVATLYQDSAYSERHSDFELVPAIAIGGSQALLLRRDFVRHAVKGWDSLAGAQDLKLFRLCSFLQPHLYVHTPNLIQHRPVPSTWGGGMHSSKSFSLTYRH